MPLNFTRVMFFKCPLSEVLPVSLHVPYVVRRHAEGGGDTGEPCLHAIHAPVTLPHQIAVEIEFHEIGVIGEKLFVSPTM